MLVSKILNLWKWMDLLMSLLDEACLTCMQNVVVRKYGTK
jgi:hypothetical protein